MRSTAAVRNGIRRGLIEFQRSLRTPADIGYYVIGAAILCTFLFLNRGSEFAGAGISTGVYLVPSLIAMVVVFTAAYGLATTVATEREDGTLLRCKALPHGMGGYVVGSITRTTLEIAFVVGVTLIAGTILLEGLWRDATALPAVLLLVVAGIAASVPIGFVVGAVFKNPRSVGGWGSLVIFALIGVSGVFTPLTALPGWLQAVAMAFPLYWLGHALRAVVLPEGAVMGEFGEQWRMLEAIGVLGAWTVLGLVLAPLLLRRMARRESASAISARREKALQRV